MCLFLWISCLSTVVLIVIIYFGKIRHNIRIKTSACIHHMFLATPAIVVNLYNVGPPKQCPLDNLKQVEKVAISFFCYKFCSKTPVLISKDWQNPESMLFLLQIYFLELKKWLKLLLGLCVCVCVCVCVIILLCAQESKIKMWPYKKYFFWKLINRVLMIAWFSWIFRYV
jgi:hypothetical protein